MTENLLAVLAVVAIVAAGAWWFITQRPEVPGPDEDQDEDEPQRPLDLFDRWDRS